MSVAVPVPTADHGVERRDHGVAELILDPDPLPPSRTGAQSRLRFSREPKEKKG